MSIKNRILWALRAIAAPRLACKEYSCLTRFILLIDNISTLRISGGVSFALLMACVSANAVADYSCPGKVKYLGTDTGLLVSNGYGIHRVCALSEERCRVWMTLVTSAKLADRSITIYYSNPSISGQQTAPGGRCSMLGNWVSPADPIYFIQLD